MAPLTFHLIPHTHWDREWYLTRAGFQARLIPVIDQVLDQLERDPDARFVLDGQTVLLDDYLAVKPGSESRIRAQVRRGALEIGPWYVLSDLLIPSAESLRRNLEEGRRDAARFGRRLEVLYSPDAFGHPAELPRLATEAGLTRAVIRRGLGRPHRTDRDLYRWEAPGGEAVLVYHLPAAGYDIAIDLAGAGDGLTQRWAPVRRALTARAASRQIAVFLGADHHAMVASVTELRHRLQALEGGHLVRVSGLTEYFDAVEAERPALTTIKGELRRTDGHAWVLQDVHSARSRLKRHHALVEGFLEGVAAPLAGLALRKSGTDRSAFLAEAWRLLLQSQFHDTLAGTTSDAVQEAQRVRLGEVTAIARHVAVASLHDLAGHDPDRASERSAPSPSHLLCWNPSEEMRSGEIVTAELTFFRRDVLVGQLGGRTPRTGTGYRPFALATETGRVLPVQVLAVR
ncbi:MAG TPA: hypothetical protein VFU23_09405 [Gemmatimonadales bacterium]|nr:hypothetical protein [Gemmatimonadales bacterium]